MYAGIYLSLFWCAIVNFGFSKQTRFPQGLSLQHPFLITQVGTRARKTKLNHKRTKAFSTCILKVQLFLLVYLCVREFFAALTRICAFALVSVLAYLLLCLFAFLCLCYACWWVLVCFLLCVKHACVLVCAGVLVCLCAFVLVCFVCLCLCLCAGVLVWSVLQCWCACVIFACVLIVHIWYKWIIWHNMHIHAFATLIMYIA